MTLKGKGKQVAGKAPAAGGTASLSGKRKKPAAEADCSGGRRRKKRSGVLQFFDDAAVDAGSDDEDEDLDLEEEDANLDFMDTGKSLNEEVGPIGKSNPLPFFLKEEELSDDELEALIKDRYGHGSEFVAYNEDSKECDDRISEVDSMKDSTVWRVKCMLGRERQIAFCFMQKYIDLDDFGSKMQIISAFVLDQVKGYVFIEAEKECDVIEACKGFYSVYSSKISLVPRSEVPHLFSSRSKSCEVSEGSWVRLKSGKYKGDLAQVVALDNGKKKAMVKLVPRVDLQAISKKFGGGVSLKQAAVPAPRLISSHELEMFRPHIELRRDRQTGELFDVLDGLMLKDGFLYKKVSIGSLICWGVQPSDMELLKFSNVSKDVDEDLNWVSSIYGGHKKVRLAEATDQEVLAKKGKGFNLHDLVLFGQKAFGVIISVEKDGFRILKGGMEGPEVVTVKVQDIKSACVDKMFTASDRCRKTISINDTVKVLEGPLQDRQGIVKHMYKGTLFIYDENETENSGFFCTKSASCENIKESKGDKSSHSFSQAPIRSYEEQDGSHVNWRRQTDRDQVFSIGQTLRIRKGPLKGYLCRVVGVYRTNVTVKLDSLVKVITVEPEFLSVPNIKRDDSAAMTFNPFGTQESLTSGQQADDVQGDAGVPTFGRDSWQAFPASKFSDADNNDNKADEGHEADRWSRKVISDESRADAWHTSKVMDGWGQEAGSSGEQDSQWNKTAAGEKAINKAGNCIEDGDVWNSKALTKTSTEPDGWEKSNLRSGNAGGWGSENFRSGNNLDSTENVSGKWDRQRADDLGDPLKNSDGISGWDRSATSKGKGKGLSWDQSNNWTNPEIVSNDKVSSWDVKGKGIITNENDSWGKATRSPEESTNGNWGKFSDGSRQIREKDTSRSFGREQADCWDAAASNSTKSAVQPGDQSNNWNKARDLHVGQLDNWNKAKDKSEAETGDWNKSGLSSQCQNASWEESKSFGGDKPGGQSSNWDKAKDPNGGQSDNWGKVKGKSEAETGGWGKAGFSSQSENIRRDEPQNAECGGSWEKPKSFGGDKPGGQSSNWDKDKDPNGGHSDNWGKVEEKSEAETRGWGKAGFSSQSVNVRWDEPQDVRSWEKPKSFGGDKPGGQSSNWDKVKDPNGGQSDNWDKAKDPNGGQSDNWGKVKHKSEAETGDWSKARFSSQSENARRDEPQNARWGGSTSFGGDNALNRRKGVDENDQMDSWKKPRKFEGGRGFGQGRGRGWNAGESENRDRDGSWSNTMSHDGSQKSSWGRGWDGNNGGGGYGGQESNWNQQKQSDCGRGSSWRGGSGRGRYGARGRGQDDNWNGPGARVGWGSARGGGGGQGGDDTNSFDGTRSFGRGRGRGRGRGWVQSSNLKDDQEYCGGGDFPKNPSNWANDKTPGWDKSKGSSEIEESAGNIGHQGGWSGRKSMDAGCSSGGGGRSSDWKKDAGGNNWSSPNPKSLNWNKEACVKDVAGGGDDWNISNPSAGNQSSVWDKRSSGNDRVGKAGSSSGEDWKSSKPSDNKLFSGWPSGSAQVGKAGAGSGEGWNGSKPSDKKQFSGWADETLAGNEAARGKTVGGQEHEVDAWGKSSKLPESKNESKDWGSNSSQNREDTKFIGGNKANGWDAAASHWTQSAACGGQSSGWDKAGFCSQGQNARLDETKSFGRDNASNWSKGVDIEDSFRNGRSDNWDKQRNFEGGPGFGRGRGRDQNLVGSGNSGWDGNWPKPMDHEGGQRSSLRRGRDGNNEAGGGRGQESNWNKERYSDSSGGRGSSWERGSGHSGATGRGQGDNWDGPEDRELGWGSSKGGSGGRHGEAEDEGNGYDGRRQPDGRGHGWICPSEKANDQSPAWGKLDRGKSFDAGSSSGWSKQTSDWNKDGASNRWNSPASNWNQGASVKGPADDGDNWNLSNPGGSHSSGWVKCSGNEQAGKAGVAAERGRNDSKPPGEEHSFEWAAKSIAGNEAGNKKTVGGNNEENNWATTKAVGGSRSAAWDKSSAGNGEALAAGISSKAKEDESSCDRGSSWEKAASAWGKAKDRSAGNGGQS